MTLRTSMSASILGVAFVWGAATGWAPPKTLAPCLDGLDLGRPDQRAYLPRPSPPPEPTP